MHGIDRRLIQNFEWPLLALASFLAAIGILNLVSASPDQAGFLPGTAQRQLGWLGVGFLALLAGLLPDYRRLDRLAFPFYAICGVLLVVVLFVGPVINGSQRWIVLGPVRMQPSEVTKIAVVLVFARLLSRRAELSDMRFSEFVVPALLLAVPAVLVLREPDLGSALVIVLVGGSFLLLARVRPSTLFWMAGGGVAGASLAWMFYLRDYQKERLLTFLDPERDPLGAAYHAIQSQIAVGSGGLFGEGFLQGTQSQLDFLPEQQTDFVFSVLAEEWGFVGGVVVLGAYVALMLRGLVIARASKDVFGCGIAVGVVALFFWSGAINIGMVLGVLPVVGIALPFLSAGGSALVTCMLGIGLLMNVSMRRYVF
jgi:rod shape determining protein RodA